MKKRHGLIFLMFLTVGCFLCGCGTGGSADATASPSSTDSAGLVLTPEELAQYDGKNGNPAYIAVDGVIYDVTNVPQWKDGEHNGFSAGNDLTDAIKNVSPHGVSKLKSVPVVGKLAD